MDILLWVTHNSSDYFTHWLLVSDSLLVHVLRIRGWEQSHWSVDILGCSLSGVLLNHEPVYRACFDNVLRDFEQNISFVVLFDFVLVIIRIYKLLFEEK